MILRTRIQKWGNSLAVRIPKAFARDAHLENQSPVNLALVGGRLVVASLAAPAVTLDRLLARVNKKNLHREVDTGPAVGSET